MAFHLITSFKYSECICFLESKYLVLQTLIESWKNASKIRNTIWQQEYTLTKTFLLWFYNRSLLCSWGWPQTVKRQFMLDMQAFNPCTWEVEAGRLLWVQGQPEVHSETVATSSPHTQKKNNLLKCIYLGYRKDRLASEYICNYVRRRQVGCIPNIQNFILKKPAFNINCFFLNYLKHLSEFTFYMN